MIRLTDKFAGADIVRTRDSQVLSAVSCIYLVLPLYLGRPWCSLESVLSFSQFHLLLETIAAVLFVSCLVALNLLALLILRGVYPWSCYGWKNKIFWLLGV